MLSMSADPKFLSPEAKATLYHLLYGDLVSLETIVATNAPTGFEMTQKLVLAGAKALGVPLRGLSSVTAIRTAMSTVRGGARREKVKL